MNLFKDRNLNIAILISASWHLIFILSVTPVFISGNIRTGRATVSFLGSILENVVSMAEESFTLEKVFVAHDLEKLRNVGTLIPHLTAEENISKAIGIETNKDKFVLPGSIEKISLLKGKDYFGKEPHAIRFGDTMVSGEAKGRRVLYKPDLSSFFIPNSDFKSTYTVGVRFKVSPDGFVESPECIISSGLSEIDRMAIRYIRRWQFAPAYEGSMPSQEGVVRLEFAP